MKYLLLILVGWIFSVSIGPIIGTIIGKIVGKIIGLIFPVSYESVMNFFSGFLNPLISVFIISKILLDKNSENTYDLLPIILILLPLILINIQAINNSRKQSATGNYTYGSTGIKMKVSKGLVFGILLGVLTTLFVFTQFSFV